MYINIHTYKSGNNRNLSDNVVTERHGTRLFFLRGMNISPQLNSNLLTKYIPEAVLLFSDKENFGQEAGHSIWGGQQLESFYRLGKHDYLKSFLVVSVTRVPEISIDGFVQQFSSVKQHMMMINGLMEQHLCAYQKIEYIEYCNLAFWESHASFTKAMSMQRFNEKMRVSYDIEGKTLVYFFEMLQ